MSAITAIADAVVTALQAAGFDEAERKPLPYVKREDCRYRRCVVYPRVVQHDEGDREDYDQVVEIGIAIQKEVTDPHSNTTVDALLDSVASLAALWKEGGALYSAVLQNAVHDGGPSHPTGSIYEPDQLLTGNLFTSVTLVRYKIES